MSAGIEGKKDRRWALGVLILLPFLLYWRLLTPRPLDAVYLCCDLVDYHYPAYLLGREWFAGGGFPLWNPFGHMGGTPVVDDPALGLVYPPNWIVYAISALLPLAVLPKLIQAFLLVHLVVGGLGTALLARSLLGLRWPYAMFAGVVVQASGYFGAYLVGPPHTVAFMLLPLTAYAWHRYLSSPRLHWVVFVAVLQALAILGGFQFIPVYVTGSVLLALTLWHRWPLRWGDRSMWRSLVALAGAGLLTTALAAVQILPGLAGYSNSYRASQASLDWTSLSALDPASFHQLLIPNGYFGVTQETGLAYWTYYLGILPLAIVVLGALVPRTIRGPTRAIVLAALAGGLLAMGSRTILGQLAYLTLPGFGMFRSVHYFFALAAIGTALLSAAILQRISNDHEMQGVVDRGTRRLLLPVLAIGALGILLLLQMHRGSLADSSGPSGVRGLLGQWSVLIVLVGASLLAIAAFARVPSQRRLAILMVIVVVDGSIAMASNPLVSSRADPAQVFAQDPATQRLESLRSSPLERVVADSGMAIAHSGRPLGIFAHRSYTPIPPPAAKDLLDRITGTEDGLDAFGFRWLVLVEGGSEPGAPWVLRERIEEDTREIWLERPYPAWRPAQGPARIYENQGSLPRAFTVMEVIPAEGSPAEQVATMADVDLRTTALLEANDEVRPEPLTMANVTIDRYDDEEVVMSIDARGPALVVMTDAFHAGWRLTIDGRDAALLRANVQFRGFYVDAGEHVAIMRFEPQGVKLGALVSLMAAVATLGLVIVDRSKRRASP